jgi:hypothetical protein
MMRALASRFTAAHVTVLTDRIDDLIKGKSGCTGQSWLVAIGGM